MSSGIPVSVSRKTRKWLSRARVFRQSMIGRGVEVMIGVTEDVSFGPLMAFGLDGIHVEILADVCFRVTPLTDQDAAEMVRGIRGYRLLEGYRGILPPMSMRSRKSFSASRAWSKTFPKFSPSCFYLCVFEQAAFLIISACSGTCARNSSSRAGSFGMRVRRAPLRVASNSAVPGMK
jgi:hypothetical protein